MIKKIQSIYGHLYQYFNFWRKLLNLFWNINQSCKYIFKKYRWFNVDIYLIIIILRKKYCWANTNIGIGIGQCLVKSPNPKRKCWLITNIHSQSQFRIHPYDHISSCYEIKQLSSFGHIFVYRNMTFVFPFLLYHLKRSSKAISQLWSYLFFFLPKNQWEKN